MTAIDPKRSYIQNVKAFPRNIEMRFYQTWVPDAKDRTKAVEDEPGRARTTSGSSFTPACCCCPRRR